MEENTERDEVYEQFMQDMQAKKKRQVKRTIREVIMLGQPASLMIDGYKSYETAICKMEARDFKGEFDVSVINTSTKETAAVDCPIYTIWFDEQFMLCNGISQASTYEEILAAMGKPDEEKEISSMKELYYEYETNIGTCSIIFSFCDTYTGMEGKTCEKIREIEESGRK